jgi:hypothetical protein
LAVALSVISSKEEIVQSNLQHHIEFNRLDVDGESEASRAESFVISDTKTAQSTSLYHPAQVADNAVAKQDGGESNSYNADVCVDSGNGRQCTCGYQTLETIDNGLVECTNSHSD